MTLLLYPKYAIYIWTLVSTPSESKEIAFASDFSLHVSILKRDVLDLSSLIMITLGSAV